jgi:hypothetical protein
LAAQSNLYIFFDGAKTDLDKEKVTAVRKINKKIIKG